MADTGTPPVIPANLQQYNSYVEDPKWQIKFTIAWISALALFALLVLPAIVRGRRKWAAEAFGVTEDWRGRYARLDEKETETEPSEQTNKPCCGRIHQRPPVERRTKHQLVLARIVSALGSVFYWTPPGIGLNAGQILLTSSYAAAVLACTCLRAPLISNPNRPGFLALSQLPPIFLLSSKNSLLSLLLPPFFAYSRLNPLHRWAGRVMFLSAAIHGALWISNHLVWGLPILGMQKEGSGVAALGVLGVVVLGSLRPVRVWAWGVFYWVHFLTVPAFFITVCYHTTFAAPWIIPPLAFYAFDLLMRAGRMRIKDAHLIRVDNQMTLIHIPHCTAGFRAGQHLRLRVFFAGRVFEAHPFSIMCAPSSSSCLGAGDVAAYYGCEPGEHGGEKGAGTGIVLGARVAGGWTRALNLYALKKQEEAEEEAIAVDDEQGSSSAVHKTETRAPIPIPIPVQVVFDGPYGGCALDLPAYERVLFVAGGSGATFAVGVMDALVAGCVAVARSGGGGGAKLGKDRTKTRIVHFVWCTRSFGSIKWFAPLLRAIARTAAAPGSPVALRMMVYVTCMCAPEDVGIPGLEVRVGARPDMGRLVGALVGLSPYDEAPVPKVGEGEGELCGCGCGEEALGAEMGGDVEKQERERAWAWEWDGGALAVCASGPEGLTREAANAVAWCKGRGREVGLHTEVFAM